jgi:hypothetical protein
VALKGHCRLRGKYVCSKPVNKGTHFKKVDSKSFVCIVWTEGKKYGVSLYTLKTQKGLLNT